MKKKASWYPVGCTCTGESERAECEEEKEWETEKKEKKRLKSVTPRVLSKPFWRALGEFLH
jgi:hypothetical protein